MLAKTKSADERVFTSRLQGLYNQHFKQQSKVQNKIKLVDMSQPFGNKIDLHFIVKVSKVLIFSIAHSFKFLSIT